MIPPPPLTSTPGYGSFERAEAGLRVRMRTLSPWLASLAVKRLPTRPVPPTEGHRVMQGGVQGDSGWCIG